MSGLLLFAHQEFSKHMAAKSEWLCALLLYIVFTSLFPIAFGGWSRENLWLAPAIMWIGVLLVSVINQENLLRTDFKLGVFDIVLQSDYWLGAVLAVKIFVHWLFYGWPQVLATPVIAATFGLSGAAIWWLTLSILLGSLFLSFVAAIGAALTVTLVRGGLFLSILILPLYIPVLCLGTNLGLLSIEGANVYGHLALLGALVIAAILLVPMAVATAIKVNMD